MIYQVPGTRIHQIPCQHDNKSKPRREYIVQDRAHDECSKITRMTYVLFFGACMISLSFLAVIDSFRRVWALVREGSDAGTHCLIGAMSCLPSPRYSKHIHFYPHLHLPGESARESVLSPRQKTMVDLLSIVDSLRMLHHH